MASSSQRCLLTGPAAASAALAHEPESYCRRRRLPQGSVVIRKKVKRLVERGEGPPVEKEVTEPVVLHCDIMRDAFWKEHPALLK